VIPQHNRICFSLVTHVVWGPHPGDAERAYVEQQQKEKQLKSSVDGAMGGTGSATHDWMHHFSRPRFRSPPVPQPTASSAQQDGGVGTASSTAVPVRRRSYPSQPSSSTDFCFSVSSPYIVCIKNEGAQQQADTCSSRLWHDKYSKSHISVHREVHRGAEVLWVL
jgi:hypothetical protein